MQKVHLNLHLVAGTEQCGWSDATRVSLSWLAWYKESLKHHARLHWSLEGKRRPEKLLLDSYVHI